MQYNENNFLKYNLNRVIENYLNNKATLVVGFLTLHASVIYLFPLPLIVKSLQFHQIIYHCPSHYPMVVTMP
jgi:hypothetical protein